MNKVPHSRLIQLLVEIVLILALTQLAIMLALPSLGLSIKWPLAVLVDIALLCLIGVPLLLWRLRAYARAMITAGSTTLLGAPGISTRAAKILAAAVFSFGSGASLLTAHLMFLGVQEEAQDRFERQVALIEQDVRARFARLMLPLNSLVGIHSADGAFDRVRFRAYWEARGFQKDFPGIRGFGYIQYVTDKDLDRFIAKERRDRAPGFDIKRLSKSREHYVITLIEPVELNREAVGLDLSFEENRRTGAEQAARTGEPTLTEVITLVQDGRQGPGFLLLVPLYRPNADLSTEASRLAGLDGFAYSPIIAEEFLGSTSDVTSSLAGFALYAGLQETASQMVFDSDQIAPTSYGPPTLGQSTQPPRFLTARSLSIHGRPFFLKVHSSKAFERGEGAVDAAPALFVGSGGTLLSALIALTLWLLSAGRARAEARARELTGDLQRLATVAERTSNSVIIADAEHRIVWVNQAFTQLSGYSLDEARGHRASELRGEIQDKEQLARIRQALQQGENIRIETVNQSRDGREHWIDLDLQTLRDPRGEYLGYVAVERDITAEKQAQERERAHAERLNAALRQTQALMDTINAHAIVSEADRDGRITHVNDAFCQISGYNREELLGQNHRIVNSGTHPPAFWEEMWETIASGRAWRKVVCNRAKDGSLYWVDSLISPFRNAAGEIEKYVSIRVDVTKARQNQKDLNQERQRLQNILEGTNVGTWEVNVQTGENRIDARWAGMLGYTQEELHPVTSERWQQLIHPDDYKMSQSRIADHVLGRSPYLEIECRLRHKDGRWVWVLSRGRVSSRNANGHAEWVSGTHTDITQQQSLYEQLARNNRTMTAIVQNLPCGLSVFDAELNLVTDNQQFRTLLELPDELFSKSVTRFEDIIRLNAQRGEYGPGEVEAVVAAIVERARHPTEHQLERVRPNGRVLDIRGSPMPGGGFVTTYIDVTQRKEAEQKALRSDEMLRHAINTLDEAFVIYDPEDRLVMCNQRYRDTYPIAAVVMQPGNTFEEIIRYGAERGEYAQAIGRIEEWVTERMAQHRLANTDITQELGNGRYLRIVERKTSDGYTAGFRIDATDLVRARIAAEEASRSKSQFLANMSHEIRTPMNAILGMLNLLQGTELSVRQLDYVQKTEGAAKSLLELLNDILDFSKVEAGKMTLETAPFRIDHLMRDLGVILSANAGRKQVEVLFDLDSQLPAILIGDSLRLKQVLINLCGNAIKFTEKGEVLVRVLVRELEPDQVRLEFSVRDTGIGIAPENLARIFEGFSQAEASTTRRFGGTGLGLAISSRLVALMGGSLALDSELGKGSTFHFQLTLGVADSAAKVIEQPARQEMRDLQVLIIDDNPAARQVLKGMVLAMGWQAEAVDSGAQGLQRIRARLNAGQRQFDAVFVDWLMPGMDGWETCLQIKELLAGRDSPLLLMVTAHGREMLDQYPSKGPSPLDGFLVKPVTPSMVLDALVEARETAKGQPRPRAQAVKPSRRLQGLRVLVVEDNKVNQQVAMELLQREGALVTLADNGQLGVEAVTAARPPYDVVLMDIQMPVMDGYEATRQIRQELGLHELPIIAMTANAMESDRQDALAAGMNDHIGKPFNLDLLIVTMLQQSNYRTPAANAVQSPDASASPGDSAASQWQTPPSTPTFDIPAALGRLGGNESILARILQTFGKDLPNIPARLEAHLDSEQLNDARRLMHTLKGSAATVGADRLCAVAAQAEQALAPGTRPTTDHSQVMLASLRAAVDATALELVSILEQMQAGAAARNTSAPALDRAALKVDLQSLMALLVASDLGSLDVHARIQQRHGASLQDELEALNEAMAALDFTQALASCETLQQQYAG